MSSWINKFFDEKHKKPLPILSFPSSSLLNVSVKQLTSDSELQAQGMTAVAKRIDAAASVSFMDLSVEAECFGADICMSDNEVPTVKGRLINDIDEAEALCVPEVGSGRTSIYINAVKQALQNITDRPILAGMIGPFSLAARLLDVSEIMIDCYDDPDMVHLVLNKTTQFLIQYAQAYKAVGAHGIMMAEPVSGLLSPTLEAEFSSPYIKKIVDAVQDDDFVIIYHNCGDNVPHMLDSILSIGAAAYHFGNAVDMEKDILPKVPSDTIVMGNLDPVEILLISTPEAVRQATLDLLQRCAKYPNFVLSSGCDMPPLTPWQNIDAFFAAWKEFYEKQHN